MTRDEMWKEFENQLKREVHTPITMSYDDSIRLAESGIEETVAKWKKRLEQEPTGHWEAEKMGKFGIFYRCSECHELYHTETTYCPFCGCRMIKESEVDNDNLVNKNQGLVKDLVKESEIDNDTN